jgi:hypothetical protein
MKIARMEIEKNLPKKGFRKDRSGHHIYFYHEYEGRETGAYTFISHSAKQKDVKGDLLLSMRKQLRLDTTRDAADLMKCPMDGKRFNRILEEKEVFTPTKTSKKTRK